MFDKWSVSMGLCYGQVCASGWVCLWSGSVQPMVSQHGFVLWSGVFWSVKAWVCAMLKVVPVVSQWVYGHGFVLWSELGWWVCAMVSVCQSNAGQSAWFVAMVSQHGFVLWSGVCQWSVSMGLCYGQVCSNGQSAWVCAMVRCVPMVSQHGFVLWSGVCQWSVSMGLCYGQVCASGQSAWVCAMVRCVPVVSQHAMVRCVPVVSQHGFVLWSGVCQWSVSMGLCYDWCMSMVNLCLQFCYKEEVRTVVHCCADNCSTPVVSNCAQIFVCFSHLQHSGILQCIQYTDMVIFGVLVGGVTINDTTCLQSTLTTY